LIISWPTTLILTTVFLIAAMLYASVGNAGASGYLAVMALFGLAPAVMKPTALVLNILVASIASLHFVRVHSFSWSIFWPFALTSIPFSYLGGRLLLPGEIYKPVVGIVLFYAAYRLIRSGAKDQPVATRHSMPIWIALGAGAGIGFLAGLIGLGGGILLTPLLLFTGWAESRQAAGVSAVFNLVNSLAGLLGQVTVLAVLPVAMIPWAVAAGVGGWIGASYGSQHLGNARIQQVLGLILLIAGLKIIFI
jgi:uncharacterized membrane protein YfcA